MLYLQKLWYLFLFDKHLATKTLPNSKEHAHQENVWIWLTKYVIVIKYILQTLKWRSCLLPEKIKKNEVAIVTSI